MNWEASGLQEALHGMGWGSGCMRVRLGGEKTSPFKKLPGSELNALPHALLLWAAGAFSRHFSAIVPERMGKASTCPWASPQYFLQPVRGTVPPQGYFPGAHSHLSVVSPHHLWLSEAFVLQESFRDESYFLLLSNLTGGKNQPNQIKTPTLA